MNPSWKLKGGVLLALCVNAACADDATDQRIVELQKKLEQQQWQMQAMADELKALQGARGKSEGQPVFAAFKDGLTFEDGSGNWKLQLNGRVQADYRTYDPSEWKDDTFSIRRARLGGTFTFLKDFAVRVEGEYANDNTGAKGTTALTYGYLDFSRWKGARIRAGQFKPFFGLERAASTNFIDFTELSLATNNGTIFNSTYDRGVMIHGDPLAWLNYNVYAVNGTGQNNDDVNDAKDVGGRVNVNFAKLADLKEAVIHVGASASKGSTSYSSSTASMSQSTEASGAKFFQIDGLQTTNADKTRWGLEAALAYGPVKFQAEYIDANFDGRKGATAYDNDIKAWYADLNWMVTGEIWSDSYKSGAFGRIKPKRSFDAGDGWGAFELGLRYSRFDASDFRAMLPAATATTAYTSEADAWTAGAKWLLNPNARIVLNYVHTEFDTPIRVNRLRDDNEDAVVLRAQYDF